jgi:uncharacterized protein (TIGR02246 family)
MRWTTFVAAIVSATLLSPAVNAQDNAHDSEVAKLANLWTEAYNLRDAERLGALYTEDAHLYNHGRPRTVGRDNIRDFWAADMKENNPMTVLTVTDAVEGVDMTLVHGNYQVLNRQTGVLIGRGRFAHIWIRTETDQWLLDRDLWNQPAFE